MDAMNFMVVFNIFIAIFLIYYAIKGSGRAYENDYPAEMKEDAAIMMRKFCWIAGVPMLVLSILEFGKVGNLQNVWAIISIVYILGCVVAYLVMFRMRFKEYLRDPRKNLPKK